MGQMLRTLALGLMLAGCGNATASRLASEDATLTEVAGAARASNNLAFGLLRTLSLGGSYDAQPSANLLVAPASVASTLAMLSAGASGETAAVLTQTLGFPGDASAVARAYGALPLEADLAGGRTKSHAANRIWAAQGLDLAPAFETTLKSSFAADAGRLDFAGEPETARAAINQWTSERTDGLIPSLLPAGTVTGETRLVLTNAMSLDAQWASPFDVKMTETRTFRTPGGTVKVPFMTRQSGFAYANAAGLEVVELPYAGNRLVFDLVLPADGQVAPWAATDFGASLDQALASLERRDVTLSLPKFEVHASQSLAAALRANGLGKALGAGAEYANLVPGATGLAPSDVIHATMIKVTEQGTIAAAGTGAIVFGTIHDANPVRVRADRPFVYVIRDKASGVILFAGVLTQPG